MAMFAVVGAALGLGGITVTDWQYWVILTAMAVAIKSADA
jgi:hypothetical protein